MDTKDWVIFKTIAEEKNITKAAERLYISQPAITYRLKEIEKEIGAPLFLRTPTGVLLTNEGEYFYSYTKEALQKAEQIRDHIQSMKNGVEGTLRLGTSSVFSYYELPKILKEFLNQYPKVELALKTGLSHRIYQLLQKNEVSVAILRGDYYWDEHKDLIREEPLCIVSSTPLDLKELSLKKHISYNTDTPLQQLIEKWFRDFYKKPLQPAMEVDSMDTCRQLVSHGIGWAVLPAIGLHSIENLYTYPITWPEGEEVHRKTWLLSRTEAQQTKLTQTFTNFVTQYYQNTKIV